MNAAEIIRQLDLAPHAEGGFFRRTYESDFKLHPTTDSPARPAMTSIYYMLTADRPIGCLHVNQSDILHYHHSGASLKYLTISPEGELSEHCLGPKSPQLLVKGGHWKATELHTGDYSLISEAVTPGFLYEEMEMISVAQLESQFPEHAELLARFCKSHA